MSTRLFIKDRIQVEEFLKKFFLSKDETPLTRDLAKRFEIFSCKGKMMRALLVLTAFRLSEKKQLSQDAIRCAASLELLHSSILIHDDVIDRSMQRRGTTSWHLDYATIAKANGSRDYNHIGRSMAICAGDIGFFFAFEILSKLQAGKKAKDNIFSLVCQTLAGAGLGELEEMDLSENHKGDSNDIFKVYAKKTALYSCSLPLAVGAILGGLDTLTVSKLISIGRSLGQAFQLLDDDLDLFGDPTKTGKPIGTDVREGRHTLLYSLLSKHLPPEKWQSLKLLFGEKELPESKLKLVQEAAEKYGIRKEIHHQVAKMKKEIKIMVENLSLTPDLLNFFNKVLDTIINQEK